jgi:hypothetical protein
MDDSPIVKELRGNPKLSRFSRDEIMPYYHDLEVRKVGSHPFKSFLKKYCGVNFESAGPGKERTELYS